MNEQAILVPQRGVTRNPAGNAMVMVVGAEEKVEPRVIKVARTVGDSWLVSEGLQAGDRVILEGIQKARPGTPVKAVPFGANRLPVRPCFVLYLSSTIVLLSIGTPSEKGVRENIKSLRAKVKANRDWLIQKRKDIEKAKGLVFKMEKQLGS